MFSFKTPKVVLTPCIGVCELDTQGYCTGCFRNTDEIARWSTLDDNERLRLMNYVLPQREQERA
jgi:predicted Fe-S protein YdhL (DUF1289 family)